MTTLKLFEASAIASSKDSFYQATLKLTFFYVFSTAIILFVSSLAVIILFAPAETELPFDYEISTVEVEHSEWSLYELRENLVGVIILVDVCILVLVSILSYIFARRTLLPIKKVYESQQQFLGDVAHELRTPLAVMQSGADTILRKIRTVDEYKIFVTDVREEIGRLTRLSNQLLQLLRNEQGLSVSYGDIDLSHLIESEARRFKTYAEDRLVSIRSTVPARIMLYAERDGLVEIVQNLLKNAIDYNKPNGEVIISLSETGNDVIISIQDTGIGMNKVEQVIVFERFVKADVSRSHNNQNGAGLGLSIVKALIVKAHGFITLTSNKGEGTIVTVTLPKKHS